MAVEAERGREPPGMGSAWGPAKVPEATRIPSVTCLKVDCGNQRLATTGVTWSEESKLVWLPLKPLAKKEINTPSGTPNQLPHHLIPRPYSTALALAFGLSSYIGPDFFPATYFCDKPEFIGVARVA